MPNNQPPEEEIFHIARAIENDELRAKYLDQACHGNSELRARVERLISSDGEDISLLKSVDDLLNTSAPGEPDTVDHKPLSERAGMRIGPYKLMEQIGEGGMGAVFVAEQERPIRRKVAVKVIKPGMDSKAVVARFEAERQALAMMDHPNIAKVLDAGTTSSGRPYFAMELVKGVPITEYCDMNKLTINERLELFTQVCQAIQHAHQKGIIHRDIKPSNVLVTLHDGKPVPKVIDFGVAKALSAKLTDKTLYTAHFQVVGTLLYMSPEQAELSSLDVDTRSDVYALGVLLYELLTGTTPFQQEELNQAGFDEQRRIIRDKQPPRASVRLSSLGASAIAIASARQTDVKKLNQQVRGDLDWILLKALEKDRTRRYESALEFGRDVERLLRMEMVVARAPTLRYRSRQYVKRNRTAVSVLSMIFFLLVAGLVGTYSQWRIASQAYASLQDELFRSAVSDVLRMDREGSLRTIKRAEDVAKLDPSRIEFLYAVLELYSGEVPVARDHLQASIEADGNWLLPHALMTTAHVYLSEYDLVEADYERLRALVDSAKDDGGLSELDRLFAGHALVYSETNEGLALLEGLDRKALPLADAIIADGLTHQARESGELSTLQKALAAARRSRGYLEENAYVAFVNMWAVSHMLLSTNESDPNRQDLIEEGEQLVKILEPFHFRLNAVVTQTFFWHALHEHERSLGLVSKVIAEGNTRVIPFFEAIFLFQAGDLSEARENLAGTQTDPYSMYARGWANGFLDDETVRESYRNVVDQAGQIRKFCAPELLLLMQSDDTFRGENAASQRDKSENSEWDKTLLDFIRDDESVTPESLLAASSKEDLKKKFRRSRAYFAIALNAIRKGDKTAAIRNLELCRDEKTVMECMMAEAMLVNIDLYFQVKPTGK